MYILKFTKYINLPYFLLFLINFLGISTSYALYFETLPKGVRLFGYRYVKTTNIDSSFNHTSTETPYEYKFELDTKSLEEINELKESLYELKQISPELYEELYLGSYEITANAEIDVHAFGLAYGFTNRFSFYGFVPYYSSNVNIHYKRTRQNNYNKIQSNLEKKSNCQNCQVIAQVMNEIPDIGAQEFQYILVDELGYKDVGDWSGSGLGDTELALFYQIQQNKLFGSAFSVGLIAPTGRVNDPDILQDIGFGDGQWDSFGEIGGTYMVNDHLAFNSMFRYTIQHASEKTLRIPEDKDIFITRRKGKFIEKLGNKQDFFVESEIMVNDWITYLISLNYNHTDQSSYSSRYYNANEYLANNTETELLTYKLGAKLTTIRPYLKNKFPLPGSLEFSWIKSIEGKNTPKYDRFEFEYRMLF